MCPQNLDETIISINFGMKDNSVIESLLNIKEMYDNLEIKNIIHHKNDNLTTILE